MQDDEKRRADEMRALGSGGSLPARESPSKSKDTFAATSKAGSAALERLANRGGTATDTVKTVISIGVWYFCSIGLIMYNKWMLSYLGFHFPIALMLIHQFTCTCLSQVVINGFKAAEPLNLTWSQIMTAVAPVALVFSLSISFVNYGQMYISVKFLQMLKASLPTLSLLIGFVVGIEKPSWPLFLNICWICGGVMWASIAELDLEFNMTGTCLAFTGFCFESLRLVLSQKLLQGSAIKFGPLTGVYYVAPLSFCTLMVPFLVLESTRFFAYLGEEHKSGGSNFMVMLPYMATNGCLAYCLNLTVYQVLQRTSAVTFGVLGQAKDWLNVLVALAVFHSPITTQQMVGYGVAVSGVGYYKKIRRDQAAAAKATKKMELSTPDAGSGSAKSPV